MATLQNSAICMGSIRGKNCLLQFLPREFSAGKLAKFFLQTFDAPSLALLVCREQIGRVFFFQIFDASRWKFCCVNPWRCLLCDMPKNPVFLVPHLLSLGGACLAWISLANASTAGIGGAVGKKLHPCNFFP